MEAITARCALLVVQNNVCVPTHTCTPAVPAVDARVVLVVYVVEIQLQAHGKNSNNNGAATIKTEEAGLRDAV